MLHCQVRSCLCVMGYNTDLQKLPAFNEVCQDHCRASSEDQASLWDHYVKAGLHQTRSHKVPARFQTMIKRIGNV